MLKSITAAEEAAIRISQQAQATLSPESIKVPTGEWNYQLHELQCLIDNALGHGRVKVTVETASLIVLLTHGYVPQLES